MLRKLCLRTFLLVEEAQLSSPSTMQVTFFRSSPHPFPWDAVSADLDVTEALLRNLAFTL